MLPPKDITCPESKHQRTFSVLATLRLKEFDHYSVIYAYEGLNCAPAQCEALETRLFRFPDVPNSEALQACFTFVDTLWDDEPGWAAKLSPLYEYEVPLRYHGGKRKAYDESAKIDVEPINYSAKAAEKMEDNDMTLMVKVEFYIEPDKTPRPIVFGAKHNILELGRFMKPIEHHLLTFQFQKYFRDTPKFAKGRSLVQRGQDIDYILSRFSNPIIMSIDGSKFDGHVTPGQRRLENYFMTKFYDNQNFADLLNASIVVRGKGTRTKVKLQSNGNRLSGTPQTALGNCIIMMCAVGSFFQHYKQLFTRTDSNQLPFDMYDDGDDCLLFIEKENAEKVKEMLKPWYAQLGHELKYEQISSKMSDIYFCQSKILYTPKPRMVRRPDTLFWKSLCTYKYHHNPTALKRWVKAVAIGMHATHPGIPLYQHYAKKLGSLVTAVEPFSLEFLDSHYLKYEGIGDVFCKEYDFTITPINPQTRATFEDAFGISPDRQIEIEEKLERLNLDFIFDKPTLSSVDKDCWVLDGLETITITL